MPKQKENFFDRLNNTIRETESSIVNFLSVFAPWLAPVIPAYMTFQHAATTLDFPYAVAVVAALVVEILGFTAVSTYIAFWFHNKKNQAEYKKAPTGVVILAFSFYLFLIVSSNVLLDSFPESHWAEIAVRALFTLQTIPAAMLVSVRTQYHDLLKEIFQEREERKQEREKDREERSRKVSEEQESSESFQKVSENLPKDWRRLRPMLKPEDVIKIASLSGSDVRQFAAEYQVTERTITNWIAYARAEINRNQGDHDVHIQ